MNPHGALKVALCFQAVSLLVLTSILAQGAAWIGVSISAMGLCFVMVGVGAAHKKSLGYLYCYATLVGIWELLALAHVLVICSLLPIPESTIDPALFVGEQLIQEEPSLAIKIALPLLYGLHWTSWCVSLVCMVCLRLAVLDTTLDFEIHDPKHEMALEDSGSLYHGVHGTHHGYSSPSRATQHRFNFRQAVISPLSVGISFGTAGAVAASAAAAKSGGKGFHHDTEKGKEKGESDCDPMFSSLSSPPAVRNWSERSLLSDTSTSFSVEVVDQAKLPPSLPTFVLDTELNPMDKSAQEKSESDPDCPVAPSTVGETTPPNRQYPVVTAQYHHHHRHHHYHHDYPGATFPEEEIFGGGEDANKAIEGKAKSPFNEGIDDCKEQAPAAVLKRFSHPTAPARRSSITHLREQALGQVAEEDEQDYMDEGAVHQEHDSNGMEGDSPIDTYHPSSQFSQYSVTHVDSNAPAIQPNSSDFSHSILSMAATIDSSDTRTELANVVTSASDQTSPPNNNGSTSDNGTGNAKSKTSLASLPLQYWRNRQSSSSGSVNDALSSPSSFTQQILPFGKKKNKMQIPTIVLHPDDDDDEPPRVLSAKDIEYLSTMPPPPLRPLVQPWDEYLEEEEDDMNGGYDYDDYHDPHPQEYAYNSSHTHQQHHHSQQQQQHTQYHHQHQQEQEQEQFHHQQHQQHSILHHELDDGFDEDVGCDPYALDVSIDLPTEIQESFEREEVKIGYGYF